MASIKNQLQEILQKKGLPVPNYEDLKKEGSSHCPVFTVKVTVCWDGGGEMEEIGKGSSKKKAQSDAAEKMLARIRSIEGRPLPSPPSPWQHPCPDSGSPLLESPSNIKGTLQELLQKEGFPIPRYEEVPHPQYSQMFTVNCVIRNYDNCTAEESGTGKTKRDAEKSAAKRMLERVEKWIDDDLPLHLIFSDQQRCKTPPLEVIDLDEASLLPYKLCYQVQPGDSIATPWLCLVSAQNSSVCGVPVTACGVGETETQAKRKAVYKLIGSLKQLGQ